MANYEFDFIGGWTENQQSLYESAFEPIGAFDDPVAQTLFENGYLNPDVSSDDRITAREVLSDYIADTYGYDFDDIFDWEAWRDSYGNME